MGALIQRGVLISFFKCLVSLKNDAVISFGKCQMLFLRRDSSFGPSVDHIFFVFFSLGRGGGGAYLIFLVSRGC